MGRRPPKSRLRQQTPLAVLVLVRAQVTFFIYFLLLDRFLRIIGACELMHILVSHITHAMN